MKPGPLVLSIAGLDPSGRAGLLADVWAIGRCGGAAVGVVTALTAQGSMPFHSAPVGPKTLELQLRAALEAKTVEARRALMGEA